MKKAPLIFLLSVLFLTALPTHAQTRDSLARNPRLFLSSASKKSGWTEPAEPIKIVGPIYFVGTKGLGSYLITTSKGHILLYTGMSDSGPMIEASIRKLGFRPEDIKYILTGHAHIDHVGGHAYLKKLSGAKVAMMAAEKELIESGGKTDFQYGKVPEFWFDAVKVDVALNDGDLIKLGDVVLTALHTPGHTKGSTTWVTKVVDNGKVYTVAFPDGTGINPGYRLVKDPSYPGIENNYWKTLQTLEALKPDIWLAPHTDSFGFESKGALAATEGVKAWVDPEGYKVRIALARSMFDAELNTESGVPAKLK